MKEVPISHFKAHCSALIEQVRKTGNPFRITRHGKVLAEIVPVVPVARALKRDWIGSMKGTAKIIGDIVLPAADPEEWEVLRDENLLK